MHPAIICVTGVIYLNTVKNSADIESIFMKRRLMHVFRMTVSIDSYIYIYIYNLVKGQKISTLQGLDLLSRQIKFKCEIKN